MNKHVIAFTCFAVLTALGGCGGGGSEREAVSESEVRAAPAAIRVAGVVSPGIIRNGQVTAYAVDGRGQRVGESLASATTGVDGAYELALESAHAGAFVEIEVTASEAGSTMVCGSSRCGEATRFEEVSLPGNFSLTTLVAIPESGGMVEASVTPWSAMAAARARAIQQNAGRALATAHLQAVAEVSQIVGLDVTHVRPAAPGQTVTLSDDSAHYAAMNVAVADMLFQHHSLSAYPEVLQQFGSALVDGVFGNADDGFSPAQLAAAIRRAADATPDISAGALEALANQSAWFDLAGRGGLVPGYEETLLIGPNASQSQRIAAFQAFTSQVRTWLSSMGELQADELTQVFGIDTATVQTLAESKVQSQFQFLGEFVDQVLSFALNNPQLVEAHLVTGELHPLDITNDDGLPIGTVDLRFADKAGLEITATGALTGPSGESHLPLQLTLLTGFPVDDLLAASQGFQTDRAAFAKLLAAHQMTLVGYLKDGQGKHTLTLRELTVSHHLNDAVTVQTQDTVNIADIFKAISLVGDVVIQHEGATFSGNVEQWLMRLGVGNPYAHPAALQPLFLERWHLSGEFVSADKTKRFSASANISAKTNAASTGFSWTDYGETTSYLTGSLRNPLEIIMLARNSSDDVLLPAINLSASFDTGAAPTGVVELTGYVANQQSRQDYAACVDALAQMREDDAFGASSLPPGSACVEAHLTPVHEQTPLDTAFLRRLESDIREDAITSYGLDSTTASRMSIGEIHGYVNLTGQLNAYTASINFANGSREFGEVAVTLAAHVNLPELQLAQVAVSARGGVKEGGHLRTTVAWNNGSYTAIVDIDNLEQPTSLHARLLNAQGYELRLEASRAESGALSVGGEASIDGVAVGHLELRDRNLPLIVYPNGDGQIVESIY